MHNSTKTVTKTSKDRPSYVFCQVVLERRVHVSWKERPKDDPMLPSALAVVHHLLRPAAYTVTEPFHMPETRQMPQIDTPTLALIHSS